MATHGPVTRRGFLGMAGGAAAGVCALPWPIASTALGSAARRSAGDRINVGCIGVGPQGRGVMGGFLRSPDARVVAVCDVKTTACEAAQRQVQEHYRSAGCDMYRDFRDLLERGDIDVVSIATCDHWHVLCGVYAAKAGKDMYIEKPLGMSMAECIALREAVHRYGRVFQFGTQQRSDWKFRHACELAVNEKIGALKAINVWSPGSARGGTARRVDVPQWLDYEMWLGPAPYTPYTEDRSSNRWWWFISDYALGFIAGWGIHPLDIAAWGAGTKIDCPVEVEGTGEFPTEGIYDTAVNWRIEYRYRSGLVMHFAGDPRPQEWTQRYGRTESHGTAFEGAEGWVHVHRGIVNTAPEKLVETRMGSGDTALYRSTDHQQNLLDCVRTRRPPVCDIDTAVRSETLCQIGEIAIRLGRAVTWDPSVERFIRDDEANRMLSRQMRSPWRL